MTQSDTDAKRRSVLYGTLAVLIAGGTAAGAWRVVHGYQVALDAAQHPPGSADVLCATHDLSVGAVLSAEDLEVVQLARPLAPDATVYSDPAALIGETVVAPILQGEPVRKERITLGGGVPRPETLLDQGTRAVTVRLDRAAGVGGLITAGNYVDVIVTIRPDANAMGANWVTETIIQAVRVLAVGDNTVATAAADPVTRPGASSREKAASSRPREVYATLEVEPAEAEKIAMASTRGDLYLSLRPRDDFELSYDKTPLVTNAMVGISAEPSPTRAIRLEKLKVAAPTRPPPAAPLGPNTEVISGGARTVEHFDATTGRIVSPEKGR